MILKELLAALIVCENNFRVLHWQFKGDQFDSYHKNTTSEYESMCREQADVIAEIIARLGGTPLNIAEVVEIIDSSEREYLVVDSSSYYAKEDVIDNSEDMFKIILNLIENALDMDEIANDKSNVGIKSTLESMHEKFDLQYRYINKRR